MSRTLVTGGCGFIGSHLVERLTAAGEMVTVIDDLSRGRRQWLPESAQLHEIDIRDTEVLSAAIAKIRPDIVVHLAAMHYIPEVDGAPAAARVLNVDGTRNLLGALRRRPPTSLLFASTAAVYPDRRGPITEACPPSPPDLYGSTKLEGERLVGDFAAELGTRCVVARIFNVVGKRETNPHLVPELVSQLRRGNSTVLLGNLESRRDYTDVRDVAAALQLLLEAQTDERATLNVGSGRSVSAADLVRLCEDVLGRPIDVESTSARQRPVDRAELVADAQLLRKTTGWRPSHTLRETLADLLLEPK